MTDSYAERFPVGTRVRVADRGTLDRFQREWHFHHPLQADQLAHSGRETVVREVGFYHGGDVLYTLEGGPNLQVLHPTTGRAAFRPSWHTLTVAPDEHDT